jgi:hypothetical protein
MPDLRAGLPAPARGDEVGLHAEPVHHHKRESAEAHLMILVLQTISRSVDTKDSQSVSRCPSIS